MKSCWRHWSRHLSVMFTFHICLCPGACLFWIIKQRALSSLRLCLFFTPPPPPFPVSTFSLSRSLALPFPTPLCQFSRLWLKRWLSVRCKWQPLKGAHWERQLIQAFTRLKEKRLCNSLFAGCFISIVPRGHVFIRCPHATGFRGIFKDSGSIRIGTKARKWHRKLRKLRCHRNRAVLHIPSCPFFRPQTFSNTKPAVPHVAPL